MQVNYYILFILHTLCLFIEDLFPITMGLSAIMLLLPFSDWQAPKVVIIGNEVLKQYTGTYTSDGRIKVFVTLKGGQLYAAGNQKKSIPETPIYPQGNDKFLLTDYNVVLEFVRDNMSKIITMISHENGKDVVLNKIE